MLRIDVGRGVTLIGPDHEHAAAPVQREPTIGLISRPGAGPRPIDGPAGRGGPVREQVLNIDVPDQAVPRVHPRDEGTRRAVGQHDGAIAIPGFDADGYARGAPLGERSSGQAAEEDYRHPDDSEQRREAPAQ